MVWLSDNQQQQLLRLARQTVMRQLAGQVVSTQSLPTALKQPVASFVTLTHAGQLRGSMGSLEAIRPLADDVIHNASMAAFHDPRFLPVAAEELPDLVFEVDLLAEIETMRFETDAELFGQVSPHFHGVILEHGASRVTFLPQIWQQLPDHSAFFKHLRRKAGLTAEFPLNECRIERYTVEHMTEAGYSNV